MTTALLFAFAIAGAQTPHNCDIDATTTPPPATVTAGQPFQGKWCTETVRPDPNDPTKQVTEVIDGFVFQVSGSAPIDVQASKLTISPVKKRQEWQYDAAPITTPGTYTATVRAFNRVGVFREGCNPCVWPQDALKNPDGTFVQKRQDSTATAPVTFTVTQPPVTTRTVDATPSSIKPGEPLAIKWTCSGTCNKLDWIGVFAKGQQGERWWPGSYTNAGAFGAYTFTFSSALAPGDYEVRYCLNDGYTCPTVKAFVVTAAAPVPVDCKVSEWGNWSPWIKASETTMIRTRTRTVVTQPVNGGAACPALTETETQPLPTEVCGDQIDNDLDGQIDEGCQVDVCKTDPLTLEYFSSGFVGMFITNKPAKVVIEGGKATATDSRGCTVSK